MALKSEENKNDVKFSMGIIEEIAGLAATSCFGVVGMAKKGGTKGIIELLQKENLRNGVRVSEDHGKLTIDLYVVLEFGVKIVTVAENLIDTVKYNVEKQTNFKVKKINVHVQCVRAQ